MRIRFLAAISVVLGLCGMAAAQPAQPTVEVRLQSVNVLLDKAEYAAGLAGKEDVVQAVKQILKSLTTEDKGVEGLDPKRPFGLYATLSKDVIDTPVIAMVPIADQDRFLLMLKERANVDPEKVEGGTFKIPLAEVANNPVIKSAFLRFANGYMYVGRSAADLDPKKLIDPKVFFAKDDGALASVVVRGDSIPAEVKKFLLGQFEVLAAEQRKKKAGNEKPHEKAIVDWLSGTAAGGLKTFLDDSKELAARIYIDAKTDEISAEVSLTPKPGSPMAKYIAGLGNAKSLPAGIVAAKDAVGRASVKIGIPADMKDDFGKVVDEVYAGALKDVGDQEKEHVERVFKTLSPMVKAGELDAAVAFYGPDAKGHHSVLAAAAIKNGKEIEKLVKDFAPFAAGAADFTFDVETIGDFTLHKIVVNAMPEEVEKVFGTKTVWLAVSDTCAVVSVEPEGKAIRAGLKAKAVAVPVASVEVSLAKLLPIIAKNLKPDEVKALMKDVFGEGAASGKDTVSVTITGGKELTLKAKVKGKGVRLLFGANLFPMN